MFPLRFSKSAKKLTCTARCREFFKKLHDHSRVNKQETKLESRRFAWPCVKRGGEMPFVWLFRGGAWSREEHEVLYQKPRKIYGFLFSLCDYIFIASYTRVRDMLSKWTLIVWSFAWSYKADDTTNEIVVCKRLVCSVLREENGVFWDTVSVRWRLVKSYNLHIMPACRSGIFVSFCVKGFQNKFKN